MADNKNEMGPATDAVDAGDAEIQKFDPAEDVVAMPDELRHLSDEELKKLEKKIVLKMDLFIL